MAFIRAPADSPDNVLPPWHSLDVLVQDPVKEEDCVMYKVVLCSKKSGEELHCVRRRYREFSEVLKVLKGKVGGGKLPPVPGKQTFGRFSASFIEERRKGLQAVLQAVKDIQILNETPEFLGFLELYGGGGYMKKLGAKTVAFRDPFKLRYFRVEATDFEYYERMGGTMKGKIPLVGAKVVDCEMYPNSLCIMGAKLPRTYVLCARSQEELVRWKRLLESVTGKKEGGIEGLIESPGSVVTYNRQGVTTSDVGLADFSLECVVGVGSFGKVLKVTEKKSGKHYAMKILNKDQIIRNKMINHTNAEKEILEQAAHPFIVKLHFSFQTAKQVVFVMDFLAGGELFFHLQREKRFSESRSKIYTAEIALALSHLHGLDVIYRDLKPENLVLDHQGYVVLTDFGLAKVHVTGTTYTFCGTPEYMAPELVLKKGHTKAVDWWSLGIFLYEMVCGIPPFYTQNVSQMYQLILKKPLEFPTCVSPPLRSVLTRLLDRDPGARMKSLRELQQHPFFEDVDFGALLLRKVPAPWVPDLSGSKDTKYFDKEFTKQSPNLPCCDGDSGSDEEDPTAVKFSTFSKCRK